MGFTLHMETKEEIDKICHDRREFTLANLSYFLFLTDIFGVLLIMGFKRKVPIMFLE